MLSNATQQRPSDTGMGLQLAWALIEVRRYGDVLQTIQSPAYLGGLENAMVRAVVRWQAQQHDQALLDFNVAMAGQPEWGSSSCRSLGSTQEREIGQPFKMLAVIH